MRRPLGLLVLLLAAGTAAAQPALLAPAVAAEGDLTPRQADVLRILRAEPGVTAVQLVLADAALLGREARVAVALPDAGALVLETAAVERRRNGSLSWSGRAEPGARALPLAATGLFVVRDGALTGALRDGDAVYTVRPLTGGLHAIARVDPSVFRPHGEGYAAFEQAAFERSGQAWPIAAPAAPPDATGAATVDVLVVYTADVAAAYPDPVAFAQLSVDSANQTYATSGMGVRLALASAFQTGTAPTNSMNVDLAALQAVGDGRFDDAHTQRDAYGADLVTLLGASYTDYCGLAYVNANPEYAFGVVAYTCSVSNLAFAHETGHNFGATHDPYVVTTPAYAYGQGSVDLPGRWRTVMSYNDECSDAGTSCALVGYWSSPLVTYPDATAPVNVGPTGDAATRDNARLLDERAPTLAAFRATPPPPVLQVVPAAVTVTLPEGATTETITISNVAAPGSRPLDWHAYVVGADGECTGVTVVEQDQSTYYAVAAASALEFGQSFTAPCTGVLRNVAPTVYGPGAPNVPWTGTLRVYDGAGTGGTPLAARPVAGVVPASGTTYQVIPVDDHVAVVQGAPYTWFLDLESGSFPFIYTVSNPYPGGTRLRTLDGAPATATPIAADDVQFRLAFDPVDRWAAVDAPYGNTLPGAASSLALTLSTAGLAPGTYTLTLVLTTNDPAAPAVEVPIMLTAGTVATEDAATAALVLDPARPNPASATARVGYAVSRSGPVRLSVLDLLGREVAVLHDAPQPAGTHAATLDARALAPGVYVVRLDAGGHTLTRRLVVTR